MRNLLQIEDFPSLMLEYRNELGATFSPIMVPDDRAEEVVAMIRETLAGKRGPITDEELGIVLPDDAQS